MIDPDELPDALRGRLFEKVTPEMQAKQDGAVARVRERVEEIAREVSAQSTATEYTPSTKEVRDAYAKRRALYLASSGHVLANDAKYDREDYAEFDRWLASILAEQGEPEWEWGTALRQRNGEIWDHETSESEEDAREHHRLCLETPDDYAPDECIIVRRTPGREPGPWLPVEEGETP